MTLAALAWGLSAELRASLVQAGVLSRFASNLTFRVEEGANPLARFPRSGPYNERLGYTRLPSFIAALEAKGYVVQRQARLSTHLEQFLDYGGFAVFREKDQAGLEIRDKDGGTIYAARHPDYVYADFDGIPPLIVATLLFIENRELLDARFPMRNPAVEWNRLAGATYSLALESLGLPSKRYGGSTLATQIEKYRHSPDGLTADVFEKLRQIASASVRAYLRGRIQPQRAVTSSSAISTRRHWRAVPDSARSSVLARACGSGSEPTSKKPIARSPASRRTP